MNNKSNMITVEQAINKEYKLTRSTELAKIVLDKANDNYELRLTCLAMPLVNFLELYN